MSELNFSNSLHRLEDIVRLLEEPCDLEKALQYYEEGMKLAETCNTKLKEAELKVQTLSLNVGL